MGTRHYQTVTTKTGELKIAQYGQWDGYPEGQGLDILRYLKSGNLYKYQINLDAVPLISPEQAAQVDEDSDWDKKWPYMSRDCGSKIHQMIEDGTVKFVEHTPEDEAHKWCDGFYHIDFSKNTFSSEYRGNSAVFELDKLPSEEAYLLAMKVED